MLFFLSAIFLIRVERIAFDILVMHKNTTFEQCTQFEMKVVMHKLSCHPFRLGVM